MEIESLFMHNSLTLVFGGKCFGCIIFIFLGGGVGLIILILGVVFKVKLHFIISNLVYVKVYINSLLISNQPYLDNALCANQFVFLLLICYPKRHPNISSQSGAICLDVLKDQWSPALTLKTALVSVQALLSAPEPKDPQDAVVAEQVFFLPLIIIGYVRFFN